MARCNKCGRVFTESKCTCKLENLNEPIIEDGEILVEKEESEEWCGKKRKSLEMNWYWYEKI